MDFGDECRPRRIPRLCQQARTDAHCRDRPARAVPAASTGALTARELEIVGLIAQGLSNRQIAETLIFSVGTVKWYVNQIFGKLHVTNRTELVARARGLGLLA
ncbi:MAG: response regulator transcription factor [Chloroflexi bacterium]|nr:response regulator transcription factor [Chloroflexota bacterium]